jgi:hypothetical protein
MGGSRKNFYAATRTEKVLFLLAAIACLLAFVAGCAPVPTLL